MTVSVADKLASVRERIAGAARRAGRDPASIRLIGAAKTKSADEVRQAIEAGLTDIGENYVQEGLAVIEALGAEVAGRATWHLIGHLQRNKAARAVAGFDVVQTVDRLALAETLSRHAEKEGKTLGVMVEVNLGGEASKSGVAPQETPALVESARALPALRVEGVMSIPPRAGESDTRRHFSRLRELAKQCQVRELSMGMTDDFEIAVEEGATMVRVGRAIFGARK